MKEFKKFGQYAVLHEDSGVETSVFIDECKGHIILESITAEGDESPASLMFQSQSFMGCDIVSAMTRYDFEMKAWMRTHIILPHPSHEYEGCVMLGEYKITWGAVLDKSFEITDFDGNRVRLYVNDDPSSPNDYIAVEMIPPSSDTEISH